MDVLIIGAGAAGLTLAIDLSRRGIAFRIVEKLPEPFRGSRGKGIQPRTQEVFEDLGILDKLVAAGGSYPLHRVYRADGAFTDEVIGQPLPATPAVPYHLALMVPQWITERIMRERLAELGHSVEFATELRSFTQDSTGITAELCGTRGNEEVRARYLVGTDGGKSFVRHALGIEFPGKTLGVRALVADVHLSGIGRDAWHRFHDGDMERMMSICPLVGTDMFSLQAPVPMDGDIDLSPAALTAMLASRTGRDIVVHDVSWASAFHMNARLADRYRVGRVLIAGDAAHTHPPTGGQGLNTSVQDAYNLGWKLASTVDAERRAQARTELLDSYEAERRPVAAAMLGLATKYLEAAKRGDHRRGREADQLDIGYPESPLAVEDPPRIAGCLAGDRAPDAPLRGAAGQPRRLFDLYAGPHWTLLGYHVERTAIAPRANLHVHTVGERGDLVDTDNQLRDIYSLTPGTWVLVRPDGYIAAITNNPGTVERYLQRV
ncbi:MAG TPA: FAD-dependent oxidoreductase [Kofleriaceae bacterium]|jgi:2-polyprenyl-6-methoxyphenol hydroxylase-like FAD-dependent oxidoreductase